MSVYSRNESGTSVDTQMNSFREKVEKIYDTVRNLKEGVPDDLELPLDRIKTKEELESLAGLLESARLAMLANPPKNYLLQSDLFNESIKLLFAIYDTLQNREEFMGLTDEDEEVTE